MRAPTERTSKPFGHRRSAPEAGHGVSTDPRPAGPDRPARPLAWALRVAALVGFLAVLATHQLARLSPAPTQLALVGRTLPADPETTGAITPSGAARATRLDPCLLPALTR